MDSETLQYPAKIAEEDSFNEEPLIIRFSGNQFFPKFGVNRRDAETAVGKRTLKRMVRFGFVVPVVCRHKLTVFDVDDLCSAWDAWRARPITPPRPPRRRYQVRFSLRRLVLRRDNYICRYCQGIANSVDHVIPFSKGGKDVEGNLVAACMPCNRRKGARLP